MKVKNNRFKFVGMGNMSLKFQDLSALPEIEFLYQIKFMDIDSSKFFGVPPLDRKLKNIETMISDQLVNS